MNLVQSLGSLIAGPFVKIDAWFRRQGDGTVKGTAEAQADAPVIDALSQDAVEAAGQQVEQTVAAKTGNLAVIAQIVEQAQSTGQSQSIGQSQSADKGN